MWGREAPNKSWSGFDTYINYFYTLKSCCSLVFSFYPHSILVHNTVRICSLTSKIVYKKLSYFGENWIPFNLCTMWCLIDCTIPPVCDHESARNTMQDFVLRKKASLCPLFSFHAFCWICLALATRPGSSWKISGASWKHFPWSK